MLLVFYEKLSEKRQTERRWGDCSSFRAAVAKEWSATVTRHDGWTSTTGDDLVSAGLEHIVAYQTGIEAQY